MQEKSVTALGKLGEAAKGAVPLLKFRYSSKSVRFNADFSSLNALVAIVPEDPLVVNEVLRLTAAPESVGLRLLDLVSAPNAKKVSALTSALSAPSFRVEAIERLAKFGAEAKPALPLLEKLKLDSNSRVREAAAKAIEAIEADKPE